MIVDDWKVFSFELKSAFRKIMVGSIIILQF